MNYVTIATTEMQRFGDLVKEHPESLVVQIPTRYLINMVSIKI